MDSQILSRAFVQHLKLGQVDNSTAADAAAFFQFPFEMQPCKDSQRVQSRSSAQNKCSLPCGLDWVLGWVQPHLQLSCLPLPPILWPTPPGLTQRDCCLGHPRKLPERVSMAPERGYCGAGREQGCLSHLDPLNQKGPRVLASNSTADNFQFLLGSCCVRVPFQA